MATDAMKQISNTLVPESVGAAGAAVGTGASVAVGADVAVGTGVSVGIGVLVAVGADVAVGTGVGVAVGADVAVGIGVDVAVGTGVAVTLTSEPLRAAVRIAATVSGVTNSGPFPKRAPQAPPSVEKSA